LLGLRTVRTSLHAISRVNTVPTNYLCFVKNIFLLAGCPSWRLTIQLAIVAGKGWRKLTVMLRTLYWTYRLIISLYSLHCVIYNCLDKSHVHYVIVEVGASSTYIKYSSVWVVAWRIGVGLLLNFFTSVHYSTLLLMITKIAHENNLTLPPHRVWFAPQKTKLMSLPAVQDGHSRLSSVYHFEKQINPEYMDCWSYTTKYQPHSPVYF